MNKFAIKEVALTCAGSWTMRSDTGRSSHRLYWRQSRGWLGEMVPVEYLR